MVSEEMTIPADHRNIGDMLNLSDTVFEFLDENYPFSGDYSNSFKEGEWSNSDDDETFSIERKAYWDEQEKLLNQVKCSVEYMRSAKYYINKCMHGTLCRTSSTESRVRNATKEGLKQKEGNIINCECWRELSQGYCQDCLRQVIFNHLSNVGFTCLIQTSKWKSCRDIPSGEHTYLEVVEKPGPNEDEVRVVIELNFRAEFEMGRASQEYNHLIRKLPQVYVGKPERLRNMIKILCGAAKKCMKDKKMHLAPWRKLKYMQAKWFIKPCTEFVYSTTTTTTTSPSVTAKFHEGMAKPRASMLTQSLIEERLSRSHCNTVKVI